MKLSLILPLVLLSSALFVDASPLSMRGRGCPSILGSPDEPSGVPSELVPKGKKFKFLLSATGWQTYACNTAGKSWPLVGPSADLFNQLNQEKVGYHFFQPTAVNGGKATWKSIISCDDSYIIGKLNTTYPVGPDDIPWLLVDATKTSGNGAFTDVTNVVRINTKDGVAPPVTECGTKYKDGEKFDSRYATDYYFYH